MNLIKIFCLIKPKKPKWVFPLVLKTGKEREGQMQQYFQDRDFSNIYGESLF